MTKPLEGVKVVEVAEQSFVPSAAAVLADWGADVVKVERPQGDPLRAVTASGLVAATEGFDYLTENANRNKRGLCLDLKNEDGRSVLDRLVAEADVFITNLLPDACEKLRIRPGDLQAVNPRLVYARGHGQGQLGPEAGAGGYDAVSFFSRGGIAHRMTSPEAGSLTSQRPAQGDVTSGMFLAGGVAAALFRRERTGRGCVVDCSLLGSAVWTLGPDLAAASVLGREPERIDPLDLPNPLIGVYRTADARWLMLTMLDIPQWWGPVCDATGLDDLAGMPTEEVAANAKKLRERLAEVFLTRDLPEWEERLDARRCIYARVSNPVDVLDDRQVNENGYLPRHPAHPDARLAASPLQFDGEQVSVTRPAPDRGAHTDEILGEAGFDSGEISRLRACGALE